LFVEPGDAGDQTGLDLLESADGVGAGEDEALLLLAGGSEGGDLMVVESIEEGADGGNLGETEAQSAHEAGVGVEELDVLWAIATCGLEQKE
jgi:hypothetical protein